MMIDVERTRPGPASLREGHGRTRARCGEEDVIRALHRDFLGKCYLCEGPLRMSQIKVDHRKHWTHFVAQRFEWDNLFPACDYCNGRRPNTYPEGGLLDPGSGHLLERRLAQRIERGPLGPRFAFSTTEPNDSVAENTAAELSLIHSSDETKTFRARAGALELRDAIWSRYEKDIEPRAREVRTLRRQRAEGRALDEAELRNAEERFRSAVSRRTPFTMLIRSCVLDLEDLFD